MKDKRMAMKDVQTVYDACIIFQKKVEPDGPFPPLDDYADYVSIWGETRFLRGKNFYAARAANIKTDVEWKIRYRDDLDEAMRIKHNNKFYNIEGILPLENDRMFLLVKAYEIKHDM